MSDLSKLPAQLDPKKRTCRAIIETPKGCRNKFDYDPKSGLFMLGGLLPEGMVFPFDFGFIPSTLGADGDPVDTTDAVEGFADDFVGAVACFVAVDDGTGAGVAWLGPSEPDGCGALPFARAAIRLGLSLRRNSASSASSWASFPRTPGWPAASSACLRSQSAARSTVWSALFISSPEALRRWRCGRRSTPPSGRPSSPPRRSRRTGRSRAAFAA